MWRLPVDFSAVTVPLPPGRYRLPWFLSDEEVHRFALILREVLPGVRYHVDLPPEALEHGRMPEDSAEASLVVIRAATQPRDDVWETALEALECRYLFVRLDRPQVKGYEWADSYLRDPLIKVLKEQLAEPDYPLAGWNVKALPLGLAMELSPQVVELFCLVASALGHRLANADMGLDADSYRRSVLWAAGQRIADRVSRLALHRMGPALEVLLSGDGATTETDRGRVGAEALQRVGLGQLDASTVRLSPLTAQLGEPAVWGQLLARLPREAWTPLARELLRHVRGRSRTSQSSVPAGEPQGWGAADRRMWFDPELLIDDVASLMPYDEAGFVAVELLKELTRLPRHALLSSELEARSRFVLTRLQSLMERQTETKVGLAALLIGAIHFWSARGKSASQDEKTAMGEIEAAGSRAECTAAAETVLAATRMLHARSLVDDGATNLDLETAAQLAAAELQKTTRASRARPRLERIMGRVGLLRGHFSEAEKWYQKALTSYEDLGDRVGMGAVWRSLGRVAQARGDLDKALELYERSLAMAEKHQDTEGMGITYRALGEVAIRMSAFDRAFGWFEKSFRLFESEGQLVEKALSCRRMGLAEEKRGRLTQARRWYEKSLGISEELGDRAEQAASQHHLGNAMYLLNDHETASDWYEKALETFEALGNHTGRASSYHQMGLLAQRRGDHAEAGDFYDKALAIFRILGNEQGKAAVWHQLGMVARSHGDTAGALAYFRKSLEVKRKQNDAAGTASSMSQIGVLHTETGQPKKGVEWNLQSLVLRQEHRLPELHIDVHWLQKQRKELGDEPFRTAALHQLGDEAVLESVLELMSRPQVRKGEKGTFTF